MRWLLLGVVVCCGCGARSELPVLGCAPLATSTCKALSVTLDRVLVADDAPRWPRLIPRGDGLDLVIGDPAPGTKSIARRMHLVDGHLDVGEPVVLDDFAGCPLAATSHVLGAMCEKLRVYDGSYALVADARIQPAGVVLRGPEGFIGTDDAFQVAWEQDLFEARFAAVDEAAHIVQTSSPFGSDALQPTAATTGCNGLARSVLRIAAAYSSRVDRLVQFDNGATFTEPGGVSTSGDDSVPMVEWPFAGNAVAFRSHEQDPTRVVIRVVGDEGAGPVGHVSVDRGGGVAMLPTVWGLALVGAHVEAVDPLQLSFTLVVLDENAKPTTAELTLPSRPIVGGNDAARLGRSIVVAWGEPTGTYATVVDCVREE